MYVAHFGLRHRPFRPAPDPAAYYPATSHEMALQNVRQALTDGDGLALVTAEPGMGKTLIATLLMDRLGPQAGCVYLTNGHLTRPADLFQAVLFDLGLPYEGRTEQELRLALTDAVLERFAADQPTTLIADEAHLLSPGVLEEVRLLGNLETRDGKAIQAVLIALPEIDDLLRRTDLRALRHRLTARATLDRLGPDEAIDYLLHGLRVAGARPDAIFSDEAVAMIARASNGVPRTLNQAAHLALSVTCEAGEGRVDAEGALEALARLGLEVAEDEPAVATDNGATAGGGFVLQQPDDPPRLVYRHGLSG